jgi:hypothetical protein
MAELDSVEVWVAVMDSVSEEVSAVVMEEDMVD